MRGVLVTGGSRGIGRSIVERFAEAGDRVLFTYATNEAAALEVTDSARVDAIAVDMRDRHAVARLCHAAREQLPSLGVLVNCAGIYPWAPFLETDTDLVADVLEVNLLAPFRLMQDFARTGGNGDRAIVNVTSINAFSPDEGLSAYDASKAALAQATRTAALELGPCGVRVNAVAPGLVEAPGITDTVPQRVDSFLRHAPLRRLVAPRDVAEAVFFLASSASASITGQMLVVDAGVTLAGYTAA